MSMHQLPDGSFIDPYSMPDIVNVISGLNFMLAYGSKRAKKDERFSTRPGMRADRGRITVDFPYDAAEPDAQSQLTGWGWGPDSNSRGMCEYGVRG